MCDLPGRAQQQGDSILKKIAVIGGGYVGLVVAMGFTHVGHSVVVSERDSDRVRRLRTGDPVIHEPRLRELLQTSLASNLVRFTTDNSAAVTGVDAVFLALPTPGQADGSVDVSSIYAALGDIVADLSDTSIVVTKSTVPVGENARIAAFLKCRGSNASVVSNPEFLQEGEAVDHFLKPDRIVIGSSDDYANQRVVELYASIPGERVVVSDTATAEIIKYASNAFLATKIAFINDIAQLCDTVGGDVVVVAQAMGMDDRIGGKFLRSGPGFGGACLPKDTSALSHTSSSVGVRQMILEAVTEANFKHIAYVGTRVAGILGGLKNRTIGIFGVAFKAGTDDSRDSTAVTIIRQLTDGGATVKAFDPMATLPTDLLDRQVASWEEAVTDVDALVILTEWPEFAALDYSQVARLMRGSVIYDTRNVLEPTNIQSCGLTYVGMGRPPIDETRGVTTS